MAFIPATQLEAVEALYIGYFGRAGEPGGVQFWIDQLQAGQTFAQVAAAFSVQAEAKAQHPFLANPDLVSPSDFVESLYVQLLGRASDAAGKAYWVGQISAAGGNAFSIGILIAQFISGAQGDDVTVLQNKVDAAEYFTGKLAAAGITGTDSKGQVTPQVDAAATDVVSGVTKDPASVTAANAKTDAFVAGGGGGGTIFTFTNQVDNLNGTPGNDTFIGDNTSSSAADTANGGSGNDTVKLFGLNANTLPQMNSIENVFISANTNAFANFNVSGIAGVTNLELNNVLNNTTGTVGPGQSVKLSNNQNTLVTVVPTAAVTSLNLTLDTNGTTTAPTGVQVAGTALSTLNLTGSGGASVINNFFNGGALKTLNIDGGTRITLNNELVGVTTIDASKATAGTTVSIDDSLAVKFTGGAGNDTVRDVSGAASSITGAESLDGGLGIDTFSTLDEVANAGAPGIKGFEIFNAEVGSAVIQDFTELNKTNTFTQLITLATGGSQFLNVSDSAKDGFVFGGDVSAGAIFTVKSFIAGGISDTATVTLDNNILKNADGVDATLLNFANVDVLNIVSKSDGTPTAGEQASVADLLAADLDVLNVSGDQTISITLNAGTNSLTVVNGAANTGGLTFVSTAATIGNLSITGTGKADTLTVDNATTIATITGGAGGDAITIEGAGANDDIVKFTSGTDSQAGTTTSFDVISGMAAGDGSKFDVSAFGFTGSQATVFDRTALAADVNDTTLAVSAAAAANFFVDLGNINRGVVVVDEGAYNAVFVDVNKNGAFDAGADLAFRVNSAGVLMTAEFTFA